MTANLTVVRGGKGGPYFAGALVNLRRARELGSEALEFLGQVVRDDTVALKHRVASARAILVFGMWREDHEDGRATTVVADLNRMGDTELADMCEEAIPVLRAKVDP